MNLRIKICGRRKCAEKKCETKKYHSIISHCCCHTLHSCTASREICTTPHQILIATRRNLEKWQPFSRRLTGMTQPAICPVSLTAVLPKMMESFIRDQIVEHMKASGLLHPAQHGFLPKQSCAIQLLEAMEEWTSAADDWVSVDIAFLDSRKAFDTASHQHLLHKLHAYGNYFSEAPAVDQSLPHRTQAAQRVVVQGAKSDWVSVDSGIPQDSVLGPTPFLIYVNDVPDQLQGAVKMSADDIKMFGRVPRPSSTLSFQADLCSLGDWSEKWLLHSNVTKCKTMHLGIANPQAPYFLDGTQLTEVPQEKDLGIKVDTDLKFHQQTRQLSPKAPRC